MTEDTLDEGGGAVSGEFVTHSHVETFELAKRVGEGVGGRAVFLLSGDLGAGKTVFAKGLAAALDIDPDEVTSPSFTLINIHRGRLRFYHIDLYRLDPRGSERLGLEEIFDEDAVVVIEWAERLNALPPDSIKVTIEYLADFERRVTLSRK